MIIDADEALRLAKYQRPGVRLIVGPTEAIETRVEPVKSYILYKLPGPSSFFERDVVKLCGFKPHMLAMCNGYRLQRLIKRKLTVQEWKILHDKSKKEVDNFVKELITEYEETKGN